VTLRKHNLKHINYRVRREGGRCKTIIMWGEFGVKGGASFVKIIAPRIRSTVRDGRTHCSMEVMSLINCEFPLLTLKLRLSKKENDYIHLRTHKELAETGVL